MNFNDGLTFQAIFFKATTTVDGAWRITLDINPDYAQQILQLSNLKDMILQVGIIPLEEEGFDA